MKPLKRSGVWVTGSGADPFVRARWNLTGLYVLIITLVVILLSGTLFAIHGIQVREQLDKDNDPVSPREKAVVEPKIEEYLEALGRSIVFLDAGTILVSGILSYWLAGRTLKPVKEAVQSEQRFFAGAAHDLRTPLTVMRTEVEGALRSHPRTAGDFRPVLESNLEEIGRMTVLVDQLMQLNTSVTRVNLSPEAQDLTDLVATSVERMRPKAAEKRVDLDFLFLTPVLVDLVPGTVDRALVNVLENAVKFTPPGGRISVTLVPAHSHIEIEVKDPGPGIHPADLPHVAEPFFRSESARSTPGSGLGLAIVRQVMDECGGSLEILSEFGHGTTVRLRLPRK